MMRTLLYFIAIYLITNLSYAKNTGVSETTTGKRVEIRINTPIDGTVLSAGSALTVSGQVGIGQISSGANILYVVDVSGSTEFASTLGQDCNGNGVAGDQGDDFNGDGEVGNTLDCEINGIIALNQNLATLFNVQSGLVLFAASATNADIDPAEGNQVFTTQLDVDNNANGIADIHEVALSLDTESVGLFTSRAISGGTNFNAALSSMNSAFLAKSEGQANIAFFLSDGQDSASIGRGSALDTAINAGYIVNTFAVGPASTGCATGSGLGVIAEATGGTCTEVLDPSQLGQALLDAKPAGIVRIELRLNNIEPVLAAIDPLGNWSFDIPEGITSTGLNHIQATVYIDDGTTATADITINDNGNIAFFDTRSAILTIPVVATEGSADLDQIFATLRLSDLDPFSFDLLDFGLTLSNSEASGLINTQSATVSIPMIQAGEDLYQATLTLDSNVNDTVRFKVTDISLLTILTGQVIDANDSTPSANGIPIVGATISFVGTNVSAISDVEGNFRLVGDTSNVAQAILDIDGATAIVAPDGSPYAGFREAIDIQPGERQEVDRPFFMPRIDRASLTIIDPNVSTQVDNIALAVSVVIPPNTAKNPDGSNFTGAISISEVPIGREPAEMPATLGGCLRTMIPNV